MVIPVKLLIPPFGLSNRVPVARTSYYIHVITTNNNKCNTNILYVLPQVHEPATSLFLVFILNFDVKDNLLHN